MPTPDSTEPESPEQDPLDANRPPGAHPKPGKPSDGRDEPYDEEPEAPEGHRSPDAAGA